MSDNKWETQPRDEDGRFAERYDAVDQEVRALTGKEKQPSPLLVKAYELGVKNRGVSKWDLPSEDLEMFDSRETALFYSAGREGEPMPRWVVAERYGDIPAGGRSKNYADNRMEGGLSVARLLDGSDNYEWFRSFGGRSRGKVIVAGWLHFNRGSDGEPLLVAPVYVRK